MNGETLIELFDEKESGKKYIAFHRPGLNLLVPIDDYYFTLISKNFKIEIHE